jgi:hypothetical protein
MYQQFIDAWTFALGGTPATAVTTLGMWMVVGTVTAVAVLVTYKYAYGHGAEGLKPTSIVGSLTKV